MDRTHIDVGSAHPAGLARTRLAEWRGRIDETSRLVDALASPARRKAATLLQELKDRCEHAENKVLQLELNGPSPGTSLAVERSLRALEQSWNAVDLALRHEAASDRTRRDPNAR